MHCSFWGNVADFKHFLPRILELAILDGDRFIDPQSAFHKLSYAEWRTWPEAEQRSIEQFIDALWQSLLNAEPHELSGQEIEDWLCAIAQAVGELSSYLDMRLAMEAENAHLNLAEFIADTEFAGPKRGPTAYWGDRPASFEQVAAWVRGEAMRAKMKAIAADYPQYDFVERAYISLP